MVVANRLEQTANGVGSGAIVTGEQNSFPLPNHASSLGSMARSMLPKEIRLPGFGLSESGIELARFGL